MHVSHISAKATKILNLLRRRMYTCSKHKAFKALVLPILDYASIVQYGALILTKMYRNRDFCWVHGQSLQLTAVKSVTGHHYQPGDSISLLDDYL